MYDPSAGFVTGGGWLYSEAGNYLPDLNLEGNATFGFVSKYKKEASVPTGNTEFQLHAGDLNFHSTSYDWMVVTGSDYARYKRTGTINGDGEESKFQIWAGDDETDTFRIKTWEEMDGVEMVVYNNGSDQANCRGNIVVHKTKSKTYLTKLGGCPRTAAQRSRLGTRRERLILLRLTHLARANAALLDVGPSWAKDAHRLSQRNGPSRSFPAMAPTCPAWVIREWCGLINRCAEVGYYWSTTAPVCPERS